MDINIRYDDNAEWLRTYCTVDIGNEMANEGDSPPTVLDGELDLMYPNYLRKMHHLVFSVAVGFDGLAGTLPLLGEQTSKNLNCILYVASMHLAKSHTLQSVTVRIEDAMIGGIERGTTAEMLWPLTRIGLPTSGIQLRGLDETAIKDCRAAWMDGPTLRSTVDTLALITLLGDTAYHFGTTLHGVERSWADLNAAMDPYDGFHDELSGIARDSFISQALEDKVHNLIHTWYRWFRDVGLARLEDAKVKDAEPPC